MSVDPQQPFGSFCRLSIKEYKASLGATPMSPKMLEEALERIHDAWHAAKKVRKVKIIPTHEIKRLYENYPRHSAPQNAYRAISKALQKIPFETLLERVIRYKSYVMCWTVADQKQFIPHPASWFNGGCYDDDCSTWERPNMRRPEAPAPAEVPEPAGWLPYMRSEFPEWVELRDGRLPTWRNLGPVSRGQVQDALKKRKPDALPR